jgi:hypothetical protein
MNLKVHLHKFGNHIYFLRGDLFVLKEDENHKIKTEILIGLSMWIGKEYWQFTTKTRG